MEIIVAIVNGAGEFVWVYNSSSDCWKRVEVVGHCSVIKAMRYDGCLNTSFSNGIHYWVFEGEEGCEDILAFDMMSEKFREIKFPVQCGYGAPLFAAYGDSIALMWRRDPNRNECELWVMGNKEFGVKVIGR